MRRLARFSFRRRRLVLAAWLAALVAVGGAARRGRRRLRRPVLAARHREHPGAGAAPAGQPGGLRRPAHRRRARRAGQRHRPGGPRALHAGPRRRARARHASRRSPRRTTRRARGRSRRTGGPRSRRSPWPGWCPTTSPARRSTEVLDDVRAPAGDGVQIEVTGSAALRPAASRAWPRSSAWPPPRSCCSSSSARCWPWPCRSSPRCCRSPCRSSGIGLLANVFTIATFAPTLSVLLGPRRRRRLRAVHRHPLPAGPAGGPEPGGGDGHRGRHQRPGGAVRRHHGLHRAARPVRARPVLPLRRRRRRLAGGRRDRPRQPHAAARAARASSGAGCCRAEAARAARPGARRTCSRRPAAGSAGPACSTATPSCSPSARSWSCSPSARRSCTCGSGLTDQGSDPASSTTRKGYDLLAAGLRPRLQRPAAGRHRARAPDADTPPRPTGCATALRGRPGRRRGRARPSTSAARSPGSRPPAASA